MIQSAESAIIFTGITGRVIVNFVKASLLVSFVKNYKKSCYKIRQACKSIDENLKRKSNPFFKIRTKNCTRSLISPEQHEVDVTCVTN
jgi:hypothetical protein